MHVDQEKEEDEADNSYVENVEGGKHGKKRDKKHKATFDRRTEIKDNDTQEEDDIIDDNSDGMCT